MSQFSPVVAAESLGYPQCYAIQSFGITGILTRCSEVNVTFSAERSPRCGHQHVVGNFTIALDGKTLVPKSRCVWKNSFTNFKELRMSFSIIHGVWLIPVTMLRQCTPARYFPEPLMQVISSLLSSCPNLRRN